MGADAIALFRPRDPAVLTPYLDLDEESDESRGLYAERLSDGAFLVHTFQPYAAFATDQAEARAWLSQFGADLPIVHEDTRGLLFFPETHEPTSDTYEAVINEVASSSVWVPSSALSEAEEAKRTGDSHASMRLVQELASSLQFGASPEHMASAVAALQKNVLDALGLGGAGADEGDEGDEGDEADDALVVIVQRASSLSASLAAADFAADEAVQLPDGALMMCTVYTPLAWELVALRLAEELAPLVAEHADPRGVPVVPLSRAHEAPAARSYDELIRALGDAVVFLDLAAAAALPDHEKAHLRALGAPPDAPSP